MGYDFTRHHVEDLGTVWINGEPFTGIGYQGLLTVNTKTYVSEPTRANDGSMPNIADHESFVVPRCKVNFKYMSLDDYQRLCNAILPNEFPVKYYDKQFGGFVEHYMYAEPEEMAKLYNVGTSVIGVLDYEVSFIGTLNKLQSVTVQFDKGNDNAKIRNLSKLNNGVFLKNAIYEKGTRVIYNDEYYEAIFYVDSFSGISPTASGATTYWVSVTAPTQWQYESSYNSGVLVYNTVTSGSTTTTKYYECQKTNVGDSLNDTTYWKEVPMNKYSEKTTYVKGDYVYLTGADDTKTYYKAIFYEDSFMGEYPDNILYWKKLSILQPQLLNWGQSIVLPDQDDLFEIDKNAGLTSADKWTVWIGEGASAVETTNYYKSGQTINVLRSMVLKATWE